MLVRGPEGLIENNLIEGVGGCGIALENEYGTFYEGPFPNDIIMQNNTIIDVGGVPINIYGRTGENHTYQIRNIKIFDNQICQNVPPLVSIFNAQGVELKGNNYRAVDGSRVLNPVRIEQCRNVVKD